MSFIFKKRLKNQSPDPAANEGGFTLVEVMIVSAIIAISAYFMSESMVKRTQAQRARDVKDNFTYLRSTAQAITLNPDALRASSERYVYPAPVVTNYQNGGVAGGRDIAGESNGSAF